MATVDTEPRYEIFGEVRVMCGDETLPLGRSRDRCLLGLLLLNVNRVVDLNTLTYLFWGESAPRSARTQVKNGVTRLRKILARVPKVDLLTVGSGYQLVTDPLRIDLHRAIQYCREARFAPSPAVASSLIDEAMSLWQRPVLADFRESRIRRFVRAKVGQDLANLLVSYQERKIDERAAVLMT